MKISKKALLYDIANLAYTIADTGEHCRHTLHRVMDICEDGNIDRVNRILALAYSKALAVLLPILDSGGCRRQNEERGILSEATHDFEICLKRDAALKFALTKERIMNLKETVHEYMVSMVLADWLEITLPEAADVWKFKAEKCIEDIGETVETVGRSVRNACLTRRMCPF